MAFTEIRFRVFHDLFGQLEILVVNPQVFVFAFFGCVVAADLRADFVDVAQVIVAQVTAFCVDD
jgi:hypothetical protein